MGLAAAKAKGVKLGDPNIKAAQEPAVAAVKAEADRAEQRHADHRRNPEVRRNDPPRNRPKPWTREVSPLRAGRNRRAMSVRNGLARR